MVRPSNTSLFSPSVVISLSLPHRIFPEPSVHQMSRFPMFSYGLLQKRTLFLVHVPESMKLAVLARYSFSLFCARPLLTLA